MRFRIVMQPGPDGVVARLVPVLPGSGQPGLPLFAARWAQEAINSSSGPSAGMGWLRRLRARRVMATVEAGLARLGYPGARAYLDGTWAAHGAGPAPGTGREGQRISTHDAAAQLLLAGRVLMEHELVALAARVGLAPDAALAGAEALVEAGRAVRMAAVEVDAAGAVCRRCGSHRDVVPDACARCGSPICPRCTRCAAMGLARGCAALYAMELGAAGCGPLEERDGGWFLDPAIPRALSPAQREAWERLRDHVESFQAAGAGVVRGPAGCLVWAVTGAGKTEVAFGAAEKVLGRGGAVLFAVPRRDVAVDVARRARQAFGGGQVRLVVGRGPGAPWGWGGWAVAGSLVVATTHQALRFYRAFSLVVVDEVDAFPYRGSDMLAFAVSRAARQETFTVVMSATPGRSWAAKARREGWPTLYIPVRHHRRPHPLPQLWVHRSMAAWQQQPGRREKVPAALRAWMGAPERGARVLVFAPTIALVEAVAAAFGAPFCHSRDPDRRRKVEAFCAGRTDVLVASSVLERGLTFEDVDVLVVFADYEPVFDEAALIQMAGRCGRTARHPEGRVLFAAARCSPAMRRARDAIAAMNREGRRRGWIEEEAPGAPGLRSQGMRSQGVV